MHPRCLQVCSDGHRCIPGEQMAPEDRYSGHTWARAGSRGRARFLGGSSHRYQGPGWIEGVPGPQPSAHLSQVTPCLHSDVLALPIFKQEESSLPPENQDKLLPFQYVLCAATSPAVKLHDETLTYLNQGEATPALHRYPREPAPAGRFCLWKLSFLEGNC